MDLNFEIFTVVLLVLSILVVGNFLRDGSSNYLEGALLVVSGISFVKRSLTVQNDKRLIFGTLKVVYVIIAVTAYYYPNAELTTSNGRASAEGGETVEHAIRMLMH